MSEQSDIRDILGEMAAGPITSESKLVQVLRHFSAHNVPLKTCNANKTERRKLQKERSDLERTLAKAMA